LVNDEKKADELIDVASDVTDYLEYKSLIDLGLQVHHSEISFEKIMLFSWIKGEIGNG
jgi:hypothetical protein